MVCTAVRTTCRVERSVGRNFFGHQIPSRCVSSGARQFRYSKPSTQISKPTLISPACDTGIGRNSSLQCLFRRSWATTVGIPSPSNNSIRSYTVSASNPCEIPFSKDNEVQKTWRVRTIDVPVGGNGNVSLEISTAVSSDSEVQDIQSSARDILIYLPSGPLLEALRSRQSAEDTRDGSREYEMFRNTVMAVNTGSGPQQPLSTPVVVMVDYRLAPITGSEVSLKDYRFPMPVHDISLAFAWILENRDELCMGQQKSELSEDEAIDVDQAEPRLSVYGSHIGGALALMLALTQPNDIHAVVVHDPMVDWVGLDELVASPSNPTPTTTPSKRRSKTDLEEIRRKTQEAAEALINLRTKLFRTPSGFFDAFASPFMFLRAPGRDTPLWRTARPEMEDVPKDPGMEVEVMKRDGGIQVSEFETRELVNERGYGPYDDDWHTADSVLEVQVPELVTSTLHPSADLADLADFEQTITDLSTLSLEDQSLQPSMKQPTTDLSTPQLLSISAEPLTKPPDPALSPSEQSFTGDGSYRTTSAAQSTSQQTIPGKVALTSRRRKVLRRWPPVGRPEDVELPYTMIYSTAPPTLSSNLKSDHTSPGDLAYVLHPQAKEMADVMSRACFWGREKSLGEERVHLEVVHTSSNDRDEGGSVPERAVAWLNKVRTLDK